MSLMTWDDRYSVKAGEWDNHHKKIMNAINELYIMPWLTVRARKYWK
jgi:hemerythrin